MVLTKSNKVIIPLYFGPSKDQWICSLAGPPWSHQRFSVSQVRLLKCKSFPINTFTKHPLIYQGQLICTDQTGMVCKVPIWCFSAGLSQSKHCYSVSLWAFRRTCSCFNSTAVFSCRSVFTGRVAAPGSSGDGEDGRPPRRRGVRCGVQRRSHAQVRPSTQTSLSYFWFPLSRCTHIDAAQYFRTVFLGLPKAVCLHALSEGLLHFSACVIFLAGRCNPSRWTVVESRTEALTHRSERCSNFSCLWIWVSLGSVFVWWGWAEKLWGRRVGEHESWLEKVSKLNTTSTNGDILVKTSHASLLGSCGIHTANRLQRRDLWKPKRFSGNAWVELISACLAWGPTLLQLRLFMCLCWTRTWKDLYLMQTEVNLRRRREEIRRRSRSLPVCKCCLWLSGVFSCQHLDSELIIPACLL